MAYVESHQALLTHRKTARLSRALGVSKITAIGHLHAFWWWCMDNAQDGALAGIDVEDIADGACWEGDPAVFCDGLVFAGFVDETSDGSRTIHDWWDYAGKLIEKRKADAARKRDGRLGVTSERTRPPGDRTSNGHPTDIQRTAQGGSADGAGTVPNLTVPNQTKPGLTPPLNPPTPSEEQHGATHRVAVGPKPAPKPNRVGAFVDAIRADQPALAVDVGGRNARAIRESSAGPDELAGAYLAAWRGDWPPGDPWLRDHLSVHAVADRIDGYRTWLASGGSNGRVYQAGRRAGIQGVSGPAAGETSAEAAADARLRRELQERVRATWDTPATDGGVPSVQPVAVPTG